MSDNKTGFWSTPLTRSLVKSQDVKLPEMLLGYFIGPFGALLSSGIFTSILQNYFTDVLKLDLNFLTGLQLFSTILIVAANLIVGQLIERTHVLAGKARPWVLLSTLTLSVASVLMFIVPFQDPTAKMVWIAVAYNLYYAVTYPIYNTANSTLIPVSTRNSQQRATLASFTNVAGLGVMGVGSMVFPMLVSFALKENQGLWLIAMLAVAIFTALTIFLQFKFTRERVTEESMGQSDSAATPKTASLAEQLKAVISEKWWWIAIVFYMVFQWSGAMKNGSMAFFCKWVLDNTFFGSADAWGASQSLLAVLGAIPMAVAAALVVPLANKFGKRTVTIIGMIVGVIGGVIADFGNGQIVPVAIGVAIKCLGSAPACYLILAMPLAVLSAMREASGFQVAVKGGKYLETVAQADTVVFDKTGTLTHACPVVAEVIPFGGQNEADMLRLAACLEEHFPHSMANAVVQAARERGLSHEEMHSEVEYIVAHGIVSEVNGRRVIIGSAHFVFEDERCAISEGEQERYDSLPDQYSHLYLAIGGVLSAVVCISDPLRPEAEAVIRQLRALGIRRAVMLTGDSERTAAAIAAEVGVDEYHAEILPADKASFVEAERANGHTVIMIGDGINDSPALSKANVGIAISDGAAIAREIADITIAADDLHELVSLRRIAGKLTVRIRSNYRFVIGFNGSLIILGAFGVLPPATSAMLHNLSTLGVSLRSMTNLLEPS